MAIRFAEITIRINDNGDVELCQPLECEDLQIITFPIHQALAISEAIAKVANKE